MLRRQGAVEVGGQVLHLFREALGARVASLADGQRRDLVAARRPPDPQVDAPGIKRFQHSELFRHFERAVVGKQHAAGADAYARGLGRHPREQDLGAGVGERGERMVLRQPVTVKSQLFRRLHQADGLVDRLRRSVAADDGRLIENAEAHCESNFIIRGIFDMQCKRVSIHR